MTENRKPELIAAEYRPSDNPLVARRELARKAARIAYPETHRWRERSAFVRAALRRLDGQPIKRHPSTPYGFAADDGDGWAVDLLLQAQDDTHLLDQIMGRLASVDFGPDLQIVHVVEDREVEA